MVPLAASTTTTPDRDGRGGWLSLPWQTTIRFQDASMGAATATTRLEVERRDGRQCWCTAVGAVHGPVAADALVSVKAWRTLLDSALGKVWTT